MQLDSSTVVEKLLKAEGPHRRLDWSIALAIGWRKVDHRTTSSEGNTTLSITWYPPDSQDIGRVPDYTTNLQIAFELFKKLCPLHVAGVSWRSGSAAAAAQGGPTIEHAANPQMALCALALLIHSQEKYSSAEE